MKNETLIHALSKCINTCNHCSDACLDESDVKMMVPCIRLDRACAEVCAALSQLLTMNYADVKDLAKVCARMCDDCAAECGKHEAQHCQDCAAACRECAEACRNFAA